MTQHPSETRIRDLVKADPRYPIEAYRFTLDALSYTQEQCRRKGHHGHIDGRQLLLGIRDYGRKMFGYLGRAVFAEWCVRDTSDFGEIVFNLIEVQLLSKQDSDARKDFESVFDFEEAFERQFVHPTA